MKLQKETFHELFADVKSHCTDSQVSVFRTPSDYWKIVDGFKNLRSNTLLQDNNDVQPFTQDKYHNSKQINLIATIVGVDL